MQDTIQIDVSGSSGVGKTTIATLIFKTLKDHGFVCDNNLLDGDNADAILWSEQFLVRLESVKNKSAIMVNEVRTPHLRSSS